MSCRMYQIPTRNVSTVCHEHEIKITLIMKNGERGFRVGGRELSVEGKGNKKE